MNVPPTPSLVCEQRPSPNFGERHAGTRVELILLHYTGMLTGETAVQWMCQERARVSSHYLVHEDGRITQLVAEAKRAWHAGEAFWIDDGDVNSRSIGIEIANGGHKYDLPVFPEAQIEALIALCRDIADRYGIPPHGVLGHSDVSPGRKIDPGEEFPWARLADAKLGLLVDPVPITLGRALGEGDDGFAVEELQRLLAEYGYRTDRDGRYGERTHKAVEAFQRHFRPARIDGIADTSTIETLENLIELRDSLSTA